MKNDKTSPWDANKTTFGTDDPELMREMFRRAMAEKRHRESTFGGYLNSIRDARGLTVGEMAKKAGVTESLWSSWEVNGQLPSRAQLMVAMRSLGFSAYKRERLLDLLPLAPRQVLRDWSAFRLESLSAQGRAEVDPRLDWSAVGSEVRDKLKMWAQANGWDFPKQLAEYVRELRTPEEVEAWIDEVFGPADDVH